MKIFRLQYGDVFSGHDMGCDYGFYGISVHVHQASKLPARYSKSIPTPNNLRDQLFSIMFYHSKDLPESRYSAHTSCCCCWTTSSCTKQSAHWVVTTKARWSVSTMVRCWWLCAMTWPAYGRHRWTGAWTGNRICCWRSLGRVISRRRVSLFWTMLVI